MQITIPFKTPTINHLYYHTHGFGCLKTEAKKLKEKIKEIVNNTDGEIKNLLNNVMGLKLKVSVEVHEDWSYKNGDIARKDIANREKFLVDAVFDALNIDDKHIFENTFKKIQDTEEYAIISIDAI